MEINWVVVGLIIDLILNGVVWLIIAAVSLPLIDIADKWTRKALKSMDKIDVWIREFVENSFEKHSCVSLVCVLARSFETNSKNSSR